MIRVLVADDQALVRAGLRLILEGQADIEVVGEAADGEEAQVAVRRDHPNVVLMDIRMPRLDGIAATLNDVLAFANGRQVEVAGHTVRCHRAEELTLAGTS